VPAASSASKTHASLTHAEWSICGAAGRASAQSHDDGMHESSCSARMTSSTSFMLSGRVWCAGALALGPALLACGFTCVDRRGGAGAPLVGAARSGGRDLGILVEGARSVSTDEDERRAGVSRLVTSSIKFFMSLHVLIISSCTGSGGDLEPEGKARRVSTEALSLIVRWVTVRVEMVRWRRRSGSRDEPSLSLSLPSPLLGRTATTLEARCGSLTWSRGQ
jgi:hypothetical protein